MFFFSWQIACGKDFLGLHRKKNNTSGWMVSHTMMHVRSGWLGRGEKRGGRGGGPKGEKKEYLE